MAPWRVPCNHYSVILTEYQSMYAIDTMFWSDEGGNVREVMHATEYIYLGQDPDGWRRFYALRDKLSRALGQQYTMIPGVNVWVTPPEEAHA